MKHITLREKVYGVKVEAALNGTNKELIELGQKLKISNLPDKEKGFEGYVCRLSNESGANDYLIYIENTKWHEVVAHECLHLTLNILEDHGVVLDYNNSEILTYYLDYWVEMMYQNVKQKKGKSL